MPPQPNTLPSHLPRRLFFVAKTRFEEGRSLKIILHVFNLLGVPLAKNNIFSSSTAVVLGGCLSAEKNFKLQKSLKFFLENVSALSERC